MIFQSIGSQFRAPDMWRHLTAHASRDSSTKLTHTLEATFGGKAFLYQNGRSALAAALTQIASDHPGASVAVNGYSCFVVQEAVHAAGLTPVFLDIEPETLHFSGGTLAKALTENTDIKAVVVQNTLGIPCDIETIERIATKRNICLIEDLAHSTGLRYGNGRAAGSVGAFVVLSFGRDKLLDTVSGGALIVRQSTDTSKLPQPELLAPLGTRLRDRLYPFFTWIARMLYPIKVGGVLLRGLLWTKLISRSASGSINPSYTMPAWQAKRALYRLKELDHDIGRRKALQEIYQERLPSLIVADTPVRVSIMVKDRAAVLRALRAHHYYLDDTWYDSPIGPRRLYPSVAFPESRCPHAVYAAEHIINLPTHVSVDKTTARHIAQIIAEEEA